MCHITPQNYDLLSKKQEQKNVNLWHKKQIYTQKLAIVEKTLTYLLKKIANFL